jgi:hypothetical protein
MRQRFHVGPFKNEIHIPLDPPSKGDSPSVYLPGDRGVSPSAKFLLTSTQREALRPSPPLKGDQGGCSSREVAIDGDLVCNGGDQ